MDTFESIMERRTVHMWAPEVVPEEVVLKALEGAHMAPCHRLTWPWRFIRVGQADRRKLFELGVQLKAKDAPASEELRQKVARKIKNPAHLIAVAQVPNEDPGVAKEDYAAISCAIQNLALIVHSEGYASKWGTGGLTRDQRAYDILGVQTGEEVVGFIWIGVPERSEIPTPRRPPLGDHVRWSSSGER